MKGSIRAFVTLNRGGVLLLSILGLLAAIILLLPSQLTKTASAQKGKGLFSRTESADPGLPNYDIRSEKSTEISSFFETARNRAGKNAVSIADVREGFVRGENALKARLPQVKFEYNEDIHIPEVITPDVLTAKIEFLSPPSSEKRSEILRNFVKENNQLIGVDDQQANALKVTADYTNPDGNMSFAHLEQTINGIPVFRGEVKAGFTKDGRMIRVINNLAPGLDYGSLSTDFRDPLDAVKAAAGYINHDLRATDVSLNGRSSTELKSVFGRGDWATTAEKIYFPTEPGIARAAWRVLIWQPVNAYYVIVDAETGTMLWRKNIANDQTQPATYNVYSNTTSLGKALNSPSPFIPGPIDPTSHSQAAAVTRSNVVLIGNEGALSFNNLGWMTDGTNGVNGTTDGNAVEAGLDIDGINGVDPTGKADGTARVFNFAYTPSFVTGGVPPPTGTEGGDPLNTAVYRNGSTTNLFYLTNRYHDALYQVGFTEPARNFQNDNFGRGGSAADRVSAEVQDSSGTNNANFNTPADGGRGRMQMFVFTNGTAPARDGSLDSDVVLHELTHGTSNRLIGNSSGLTSNRAGGSGEGWSDFYAFLLAVKPTDPINSVFTTGGYVTYKCCGATTFVDNYYYGIRRLPYAPMAYTGGPSNRPFNPLTLADIQTTTATDGAYPCSTLIRCPGTATEVHNAGEIWAVTGVEVWGRFATRLGVAAGTLRTMQLYTDGMKLSPLNPNYIQSRDSIIAAAAALPLAPDASADVADVREGFRIRGMGFSATDNGTTAVEAFDTPNVRTVAPFSVSDTPGNNNGVPEPGENVLLSIAVTNPNTGATINSVVVNVNGGTNVSYGTINDGATVTKQIPFAIPAAACGSTQNVTINVTSSAGTQTPVVRSFVLGSPVGVVQNFDGLTAPAIPAGWTTAVTGSGAAWVTSTTTPDTAPNAIFAGDPASTSGNDITTADIPVTSSSANVQFRLNYNTELGYDGMVLEISNPTVNAGAFQDIVTAGGTFTQNGYPRALNTSANPLTGRSAWTGSSAGYVTVSVNLPASAAGQNIKLKFRMGSDASVGGTGVNVDGIQVINSYTCAAVTAAGVTVTGRVMTPDGRGLSNARVIVTDPQGIARTAITGTRGNYLFDDIQAGQTYVIGVKSKRYSFSSRLLTVTDNISDVDFIGQ